MSEIDYIKGWLTKCENTDRLSQTGKFPKLCESDLYKSVKKMALENKELKAELANRENADPLTALSAVMREHGLTFQTLDGITIYNESNGILSDIDFDGEITADDIKQGKDNE